MELRHLKYFVAVAEELHFGRAAQRLYLTQPALSKQIRRLEEELDVKLFRRTKHQVELTKAGEVFLEAAKKLLIQTEEIVQITKRVSRGEVGELRVSFTASALHGVLPRIVQMFHQRYPDVELKMIETCTEDQVKALKVNEVDVSFLHPPLRDRSLKLYPIGEESILAAIPANHPLANQEQISLELLANEPLIVHPRHEGPVLYDQFINQCEQAGFKPKIVQEVMMIQTRIGLVAAGIGISFISENLKNLVNPGVVYRSLAEPKIKLQLAVAWQPDNISPVLREFLKVVHDFSV